MHYTQARDFLAVWCQLGKMFRKGEEFAHEYSRINSSRVYNSNFHKRTTNDSSSCENRQQEGTFISFGDVGYKTQRAYAHERIHLGLPSQQTNYTICRVPSHCSECPHRLGVTQLQRSFKLEDESFNFPRDSNTRNNRL